MPRKGKKHLCIPAGPGSGRHNNVPTNSNSAPGASQSINTYYTPSPKFDSMNADQLSAFIQQKIDWLTEKQAREATYLAKRARRGSNTTTDDNYNADQPQERELLAFLAHFKKIVEDQI